MCVSALLPLGGVVVEGWAPCKCIHAFVRLACMLCVLSSRCQEKRGSVVKDDSSGQLQYGSTLGLWLKPSGLRLSWLQIVQSDKRN